MTIEGLKAMPGHLVRRAQQVSTALFAEAMAEYDLTSVQLMALVAIAEVNDLDATRLAELIAFDRATIGGVIERLERKRLIVRTPSTQDKRIKLLAATPAGRALITVSAERVEQVQARLLEPLDPQEQVVFQRLLAKVARETE